MNLTDRQLYLLSLGIVGFEFVRDGKKTLSLVCTKNKPKAIGKDTWAQDQFDAWKKSKEYKQLKEKLAKSDAKKD